jgi:hypothetical protein
LGLPGLIEEKRAEQAGSSASGGTAPRVPASDGADAGACSGAGNRALLGWRHVGASGDRQSEGRERQ